MGGRERGKEGGWEGGRGIRREGGGREEGDKEGRGEGGRKEGGSEGGCRAHTSVSDCLVTLHHPTDREDKKQHNKVQQGGSLHPGTGRQANTSAGNTKQQHVDISHKQASTHRMRSRMSRTSVLQCSGCCSKLSIAWLVR